MSIFKELLHRRFWLSAAVLLCAVLCWNALGAWLCTIGWLPIPWARWWVLSSWIIAGFAGGRVLGQGREGSVPRALFLCLIIYGVMLALSPILVGAAPGWLTWWQIGLALLGGAVFSGLLGPVKKRRRKKSETGKPIQRSFR